MPSPHSPAASDIAELLAQFVPEKKQAWNTNQKGASIGIEIGRQIGMEIGNRVEQAITTALLKTEEPSFDVREQILANVNFAIDCYKGLARTFEIRRGITVVILGHADAISASVYANTRPLDDDEVGPIIQSPFWDTAEEPWDADRVIVQPLIREENRDSDKEALLALLEASKTALARTLCEGSAGFCDSFDPPPRRYENW